MNTDYKDKKIHKESETKTIAQRHKIATKTLKPIANKLSTRSGYFDTWILADYLSNQIVFP